MISNKLAAPKIIRVVLLSVMDSDVEFDGSVYWIRLLDIPSSSLAVNTSNYLVAPVGSALLPVLNVIGVFAPFGETRTYPCISWCSAEQKSVQ